MGTCRGRLVRVVEMASRMAGSVPHDPPMITSSRSAPTADLPGAIREIKAALRAPHRRPRTHGRGDQRRAGAGARAPGPVIDNADIANDTVPVERLALLRRASTDS